MSEWKTEAEKYKSDTISKGPGLILRWRDPAEIIAEDLLLLNSDV